LDQANTLHDRGTWAINVTDKSKIKNQRQNSWEE